MTENENVGLRSNSFTNTPSGEAFKTLRTNLLYSESARVITVTSSLPSEGKSYTSFNLALSFALIQKRTLLIDCDLRKGTIKRYISTKHPLAGLSEGLTGQADSIIQGTNNPYLDIVVAGKYPPNPSELLSNDTFKRFIENLKQEYDYIILDTPPLAASADATIVGQLSDGVVLVVRNDYVKKKIVQRTKEQLLRNGSRVLGVVLNRVKKGQEEFKNYSYGYYYDEK